ncbi:hypothetical protein YC2023_080372 [Brassica napus]
MTGLSFTLTWKLLLYKAESLGIINKSFTENDIRAGARVEALLRRNNRVVSDVAALGKGKMLLSNASKEKSRTSRFLNFLRLL